MHTEKTIGSTPLYYGKILNLRKDLVKLEDGSTTVREVIEHPGGVCILALDEDGKIFFVRQFRYPFGRVLLELPAGKLEPGEEPEACAVRELRVETGCSAGRLISLGKMIPTCAYDTEVIHLFYADGLIHGEQQLDESEFLTVEKLSFSQAMDMVLNGEIIDAKTQLALLKLAAFFNAEKLEMDDGEKKSFFTEKE